MMTTLSCASSARESDPATSSPNETITFADRPLYVALNDELGYSFGELLQASNQYRANSTSTCLAANGYDVGSTSS